MVSKRKRRKFMRNDAKAVIEALAVAIMLIALLSLVQD